MLCEKKQRLDELTKFIYIYAVFVKDFDKLLYDTCISCALGINNMRFDSAFLLNVRDKLDFKI